jgi:2-amino-4-hydroxy-6-hydroxymethyldihydropteridine diphosphokinase
MGLAFVGLGSNLGRGRENLLLAWKNLGKIKGLTCLALSSPYFTEPVGVATENWFTNAVGVLESRPTPEKLLDYLLDMEKILGRDRSRGIDRTIDLDLLFYDDLIISSPTLTLPHPEIADRLFVLAPLAEVAPDHVHPLLRQTSRQMLQRIAKSAKVEKKSWPGEKK